MSILFDGLLAVANTVLSKVIPDKSLRDTIAFDLATLSEKQANEQILAQMEVNKAEAAHKNLFVAGWRPGVGWVCVLGMFINFIVVPLSMGYLEPLDLTEMMPVLLGMLGLGGMRSYEKKNGVAREK